MTPTDSGFIPSTRPSANSGIGWPPPLVTIFPDHGYNLSRWLLIRAKAEESPDAQLTPDDLAAWEAEHGEIPAGAIVAMNSGWDGHVASATFRKADDEGVMHFPGFHIEAIEFLLGERDVKGLWSTR